MQASRFRKRSDASFDLSDLITDLKLPNEAELRLRLPTRRSLMRSYGMTWFDDLKIPAQSGIAFGLLLAALAGIGFLSVVQLHMVCGVD